jgi:hypothetical protein
LDEEDEDQDDEDQEEEQEEEEEPFIGPLNRVIPETIPHPIYDKINETKK